MEDAERARFEVRIARLEQQIRSFKDLHASELGLIQDELAALRADLAPRAAPDLAAEPQANETADPAASSPRRAAWLAEQEREERERREPISRRELLRGRGRDGEGA